MEKGKKQKRPSRVLANRIWEDIVSLHTSYTNDSHVSKFFLPEEISSNCRQAAVTFALSLYNPPLIDSAVYTSQAYFTFLLSTITGAQIYLRERSFSENAKPYTLITNKHEIEIIKETVLQSLGEKVTLPEIVQQVMRKFLEMFLQKQKIDSLQVKGKVLEIEKYDSLLTTSILWGYFFAKKMVNE